VASSRRARIALGTPPRFGYRWSTPQVAGLVVLAIGARDVSVCEIRCRWPSFWCYRAHHRLFEITPAACNCMFLAAVVLFMLVVSSHICGRLHGPRRGHSASKLVANTEMSSRRQFLFFVGTTVGLTPVMAWMGRSGTSRAEMKTKDEQFPVSKTDEEWRRTLTPDQYQVLRKHSTERAFTSALNAEKRDGMFVCAGCGQPLFASETKFESGTGWPSFYKPLDGAVGTESDRSWFVVRTEVHCSRCGGHLGHVFPDGPKPTGQRYCMNGVAMKFVPK